MVRNLTSYQIVLNYAKTCLLCILNILIVLLIHSVNFVTFYHFLFLTAFKQKLDGKTIHGIHKYFYMVLIQSNNQQIWTLYIKANSKNFTSKKYFTRFIFRNRKVEICELGFWVGKKIPVCWHLATDFWRARYS